MNYLLSNIKPRNKIIVDLLATKYQNALEIKNRNVRLFVNSISRSIYYQIKGLVANNKFTLKDPSFFWKQIKEVEDSSDYIYKHYNIYWTDRDCHFFDKMYTLIINKIKNEYIKSFLFSVLIELMIHQSVYGRFNISTEGYIFEKETLTKDKFLFSIEDLNNKIRSGSEVTVVYKDLELFIKSINTAGIIYFEIPTRNIFYDYHPIFDIFDNYGGGIFKDKKLHISEAIKQKAERYIYRGDKFIKRWAALLPLILEIDFENLVFKLNNKMDVEKEWLQEKLSKYGPTKLIKPNYILLTK